LLDDAGPEGGSGGIECATHEVRAWRSTAEPVVVVDRARGIVDRAAVKERLRGEPVVRLGDVGAEALGRGIRARVVRDSHVTGSAGRERGSLHLVDAGRRD